MTKTNKRKGLGRGLGALLSAGAAGNSVTDSLDIPEREVAVTSAESTQANTVGGSQAYPDGHLTNLPIEFMQRGKYQPRKDMREEALLELAESIKAQGVMQPIVVRRVATEKFEIIAGERRWRASQLAGLAEIPVIVRDISDEAAIAMALIENIQREDLNPIEEAVALKRLQDEFDLTHQEVAEAVGKSRAAVSNSLRLLNLCQDVRTMLEHGDLEMGHARCLLSLDVELQKQLGRQIVARGLSVRQAEALVRNAQKSHDATSAEGPVTADIARLQEGLAEKVGVPVQLQHSAKGSGKLVLKYNNLDELDGILQHLGYES